MDKLFKISEREFQIRMRDYYPMMYLHCLPKGTRLSVFCGVYNYYIKNRPKQVIKIPTTFVWTSKK